jgi:O-antigen ligase
MEVLSSLNKIKSKVSSKINPKCRGYKFFNVSICVLFFLASFLALTLDAIKPFNYILIAIWALLSGFVLLYIVFFGEFKFHYYIFLSVLFVLLQLFSWAINGFKIFNQTGLLLGILSIVLFELLLQKKANNSYFVAAFVVASWLFLLVFIFTNIGGVVKPNISNRIGSNLGNSNDVARHVSFSILANYIVAIKNKKILLKILTSIFATIGFYLLILTGSVSNLLVVSVVLVCSMAFLFGRRGKLILLISLVSFIIVFILIINLPFMSYFKERLSGMLNSLTGDNPYSGDDSFEARLLGAYYGMGLFVNKPFFGNGFDSVYANYSIMAHNNFIEILADFGIFAFIVEEIMLFVPFVHSIKNAHLEKDSASNFFVFVVMLFIILFQFFLVSYNSKVECMLIPICMKYSGIDIVFIKDKCHTCEESFDFYEVRI